MPTPKHLALEGDRFIHLTPALPGYVAWFRDGESLEPQPVLCWAIVEKEIHSDDRLVLSERDRVPRDAVLDKPPLGVGD